MPEISVIIPVYNTEKYLSECLDSVLAQTFKDIEIICVNDGSSDNSGRILEEYTKRDTRIKVITQSNQGLSAARNAGLDEAKGEWIAFLDSDDRLPPYALEVLYQIALKSLVEIVASRSFGNVETSNFDYILHKDAFYDFVLDRKIFSSACNKLFKASLFQNQRFTKGMLFEDWPVMTILFSQIQSYATTEIPCYIYREDNLSITRSLFSEEKVNSYIRGIRMVYEHFKNTDKLEMARKRMSVAIKMLVNKVYRAKNKELNILLINAVQKLFDEKIILKRDLILKTRWRLWRLKHS